MRLAFAAVDENLHVAIFLLPPPPAPMLSLTLYRAQHNK